MKSTIGTQIVALAEEFFEIKVKDNDLDQPFDRFGIDSFSALEFVNRIVVVLELENRVSTESLQACSTLNELIHLVDSCDVSSAPK